MWGLWKLFGRVDPGFGRLAPLSGNLIPAKCPQIACGQITVIRLKAAVFTQNAIWPVMPASVADGNAQVAIWHGHRQGQCYGFADTLSLFLKYYI
jgi:hypothetical protein